MIIQWKKLERSYGDEVSVVQPIIAQSEIPKIIHGHVHSPPIIDLKEILGKNLYVCNSTINRSRLPKYLSIGPT